MIVPHTNIINNSVINWSKNSRLLTESTDVNGIEENFPFGRCTRPQSVTGTSLAIAIIL